MRPVHVIVVGSILLGWPAGGSLAAGAKLELSADTSVATAGYYQLRWESGESALRLVEAEEPGFRSRRVVYEGADTARLVSGKPDGTYYYRLEADDSAGAAPVVRSDAIAVEVRHHALGRAVAFFSVGAAVFAATLGLIILGGRSVRGG
jgi:hypothetical protein